MKTIKFKPLRRIKKTGKLTVAGYMQWRKMLTADYSDFELILYNFHDNLHPKEFVYNHNGEQLFFYDFNPSKIPVYESTPMLSQKIANSYLRGDEFPLKIPYGISYGYNLHTSYNGKGMDCDGVPTFSHLGIDNIVDNYSDLTDFVPLTVEIVLQWYGWFLWRLNNSKLTFAGDNLI